MSRLTDRPSFIVTSVPLAFLPKLYTVKCTLCGDGGSDLTETEVVQFQDWHVCPKLPLPTTVKGEPVDLGKIGSLAFDIGFEYERRRKTLLNHFRHRQNQLQFELTSWHGRLVRVEGPTTHKLDPLGNARELSLKLEYRQIREGIGMVTWSGSRQTGSDLIAYLEIHLEKGLSLNPAGAEEVMADLPQTFHFPIRQCRITEIKA